MKQKGHRIVKAAILFSLVIIINTLLGLLVNSFYNIIITLSSNNDNSALIIFWSAIVIPVIINGLFIYHMPSWVDSWVKSQGEWYLRYQIEYMQNILDREEAEPQTLKGIYDKNKPKAEKLLKKALMSGSKE